MLQHRDSNLPPSIDDRYLLREQVFFHPRPAWTTLRKISQLGTFLWFGIVWEILMFLSFVFPHKNFWIGLRIWFTSRPLKIWLYINTSRLFHQLRHPWQWKFIYIEKRSSFLFWSSYHAMCLSSHFRLQFYLSLMLLIFFRSAYVFTWFSIYTSASY